MFFYLFYIYFYLLIIFYLHLTGNFPAISDDLVNSYHLLLCCLDLIYSNASTSQHKKNLINPTFEGKYDDFIVFKITYFYEMKKKWIHSWIQPKITEEPKNLLNKGLIDNVIL